MRRNAIMSFLRGKVRTERRGTKTRQRFGSARSFKL